MWEAPNCMMMDQDIHELIDGLLQIVDLFHMPEWNTLEIKWGNIWDLMGNYRIAHGLYNHHDEFERWRLERERERWFVYVRWQNLLYYFKGYFPRQGEGANVSFFFMEIEFRMSKICNLICCKKVMYWNNSCLDVCVSWSLLGLWRFLDKALKKTQFWSNL